MSSASRPTFANCTEYSDIVSSKDHPRVCGEQTFSNIEQQSLEGSPPRVRGTVPVCQLGQQIPGITPACAGNRLARKVRKNGWEDHPRVCGEQKCTVCISDFI